MVHDLKDDMVIVVHGRLLLQFCQQLTVVSHISVFVQLLVFDKISMLLLSWNVLQSPHASRDHTLTGTEIINSNRQK